MHRRPAAPACTRVCLHVLTVNHPLGPPAPPVSPAVAPGSGADKLGPLGKPIRRTNTFSSSLAVLQEGHHEGGRADELAGGGGGGAAGAAGAGSAQQGLASHHSSGGEWWKQHDCSLHGDSCGWLVGWPAEGASTRW